MFPTPQRHGKVGNAQTSSVRRKRTRAGENKRENKRERERERERARRGGAELTCEVGKEAELLTVATEQFTEKAIANEICYG